MPPLELITNLATSWRYLHQLQFWPLGDVTCISWKLGHQVAPLAFIQHLVIRWRHLHWFQSWPSGGDTCKFGHQFASTCIGTLTWIALLAISVSIELVSSSARVNSVKFVKGQWQRFGPIIDGTPGIPGSDKNHPFWVGRASVNIIVFTVLQRENCILWTKVRSATECFSFWELPDAAYWCGSTLRASSLLCCGFQMGFYVVNDDECHVMTGTWRQNGRPSVGIITTCLWED